MSKGDKGRMLFGLGMISAFIFLLFLAVALVNMAYGYQAGHIQGIKDHHNNKWIVVDLPDGTQGVFRNNSGIAP